MLFLGGRPSLQTPHAPIPLDKVAHFAVYGVLGLLTAWGWQQAGRRGRIVLPLVLAALVGAADELHQRSVPNRSSELADFVADSSGIAVAAALYLRLRRTRTDG